MEHFGICEREEGDGNNSAFTLVLPKENTFGGLPKENQGESKSKLIDSHLKPKIKFHSL